MGYVPKRKTYRLKFEDPDMDGLEVRMAGLSTGEMLDAMRISGNAEEDSEELEQLLQLVADKLISWNIETEAGQPVEPTLDAIKTQDLDLNLAIDNAWMTAINGVPAPLPTGSLSGEPSLVASIPTETLSESLAS